MLFHRRDKREPGQRNQLDSAAKVTSPGPKRESTDSYTIPITYPGKRYSKTEVAMSSDGSIGEAEDQVDFNTK